MRRPTILALYVAVSVLGLGCGRPTFTCDPSSIAASDAHRPYFMYASTRLTAPEITQALACYGSDIYVGFDSLCDLEVDGCDLREDLRRMADKQLPADDALRFAVEKGVHLHAYVEGPGGKTDGQLAPDEADRVVAASKTVGDTCDGKPYAPMTQFAIDTPTDDPTQQWLTCGWREYTFSQLCRLGSLGFETAEIDNLENDASFGGDRSPTALSAFLAKFGDFQCDGGGHLPRLVLKNLNEAEWKVVHSFRLQEGRDAIFAPFAILEADKATVLEREPYACAAGVTLLRGPNTRDYYAWGPASDCPPQP